jgi:phosphoribosylpyrophosphate synthetase
MIDTGRTVSLAARLLKANGAKEIYVIVSHGMLLAKYQSAQPSNHW